MRRGATRSGVDRNHAQFSEHALQRELPETRPGDLMPAAKKATNRMVQMQVYRASRLRDRAIAEVAGPSLHRTVQGARDFLPWRLETGPQPAPNAFLDGGHRLPRRLRTVVATAGAWRVHRSKGIAEKRKGLASCVAHSGLSLVQREPDAGHPSPYRLEDLAGSMPAEHHKVVSIVDQHRAVPTVKTVFAKRLDEAMHVDVRQQRRRHPALRRSPGRLLSATHPPMSARVGLLDRRFQPHPDQTQHLPVTDAPCHARHQLRVRNRVEVLRHIGVDDFGVPLINRLMDPSNRIVRTPLRAIPIGRLIEIRFENRFQHQHRCGLYDPIADRGDAERPLTRAPKFGNHHSFDRSWCVAFAANLLPHGTEPAVHAVCFDARERFSINARRPTVRMAARVGVREDVFTPHLVIQRMEPPRRLLLGLHVERSLERPNLFWSCQAHANLLLSARSNALRTRAPSLPRRYSGSTVV